MDKILSVIVATYNMESYLERCLDSMVASEMLPYLEIIVVNDGSRDNSLMIAKSYLYQYPESIVVIDKENGHYGSCVMAGLQIAKGKYFRMVDADDWVNTRGLDSLLKQLMDCNSDLIITLRSEWFLGDSRYPRLTTYSFGKDIVSGKEYNLKSFCIHEHVALDEFNMHSMTYKTSVLRAEKGIVLPKGVCYTDFLYCFYPIDRAQTISIFNIPLYIYYIGRDEQSVSSRSLTRNLHHISTVLNCMINYYENTSQEMIIRKNQMHFIRKALGFFSGCLFCRKIITDIEYEEVFPILLFIERHHIPNHIYEKKYFMLFRKFKAKVFLNFCLWIHAITHRKFVRNPSVLQYVPEKKNVVEY